MKLTEKPTRAATYVRTPYRMPDASAWGEVVGRDGDCVILNCWFSNGYCEMQTMKLAEADVTRYDAIIRQIILGWRDHFSGEVFTSSDDAVAMAFNLVADNAWGNKAKQLSADGDEEFCSLLDAAIRIYVTSNCQIVNQIPTEEEE